MYKKLILLYLFLGSFCLPAQTFDKTKLDNYFNALETHDKYMGSVAISQNGKVVYTRSLGFASVEDGIKASEKTKYRIGSISKTFTTVLVFKAIEEKKLDLSHTIASYFPTVKHAEKITISNLLNHRSGIHSFTGDAHYLEWNTQPQTEQQLLEIITKGGSDFEPDTKAEYSNSNFVLLSFILEKVYKKSYATLLNEKIIKPLQLKDTYMGGKNNLKNNESHSYSFMGKWEKESETDMSIPLGAGAIVSTPADLTRFMDALFDGKLLSKANLEQMKTIKDDYGMGLFLMPYGENQGFGHTGGIDGFSSMVLHFPEDKVTLAMTSNGKNYSGSIGVAIMSIFYGDPFEIPDFKGYDISSADLDQFLGVYASPQIPLKITITKNDKTLMAQATGQSAFPMEATAANAFKFDPAGIVIEFDAANKQLTLKQGGATFLFTRE